MEPRGDEDGDAVAQNAGAAQALDLLENLRAFLPHVTKKGRLNGGGVALDAVQKLAQHLRKVAPRRQDAGKILPHPPEFVFNDRVQQLQFGVEVGIKRLFAHAQFPRQIVHGDAAKTVGEEMAARVRHNALAGRRFGL